MRSCSSKSLNLSDFGAKIPHFSLNLSDFGGATPHFSLNLSDFEEQLLIFHLI
jgi:hypothetical protein